MSKKITDEQIRAIAKSYGIEFAALKAVIQVEASGQGFLPDGKPKILFEPHIFHRLLGNKNYFTVRKNAMLNDGDICYPKWGTLPYGKVSQQHERLERAAKYDRESALMACSWGMGQVLGENWAALGYSSLQEFINAAYKDEAAQVDCMCRFIKVNGLIDELQRKDWAGFARVYNGIGFAKNQYDKKLAAAYRNYR